MFDHSKCSWGCYQHINMQRNILGRHIALLHTLRAVVSTENCNGQINQEKKSCEELIKSIKWTCLHIQYDVKSKEETTGKASRTRGENENEGWCMELYHFFFLLLLTKFSFLLTDPVVSRLALHCCGLVGHAVNAEAATFIPLNLTIPAPKGTSEPSHFSLMWPN